MLFKMHFSYVYLFHALLIFFDTARCDFEMLILHTNDMHSRFDEINVNSGLLMSSDNTTDRYGGFARLKKAVTMARAEADNENIPSLFLNAGDTFQGTSFYSIFKEKIVSSLISLLDIDVMCLGNHEFDDDVVVLSNFLKSIKIPVVASNLDLSQEHELFNDTILLKSWVTIKNGRKIGVIGYITPNTTQASSTGKVIFENEVKSIEKEVIKLKNEGINIIIALGHSGFEMDKIIARSIPEISLVIGGHTNTFLYTPPDKPPSIENAEGPYPYIVTQSSGKNVPVLSAFAYTKYLGKLWVTFDEDGNFTSARKNSNPLLLNSSIELDASVQEQVNKWRQKFSTLIQNIVGKTNVHLDGWRAKCKYEECNLGNFVTDAFVDLVTEQFNDTYGWTDAPIAIIQSGALRSALVRNKTHGNMTYEEIITMLPYKTPLLKVHVLGSTLRKALEHSVFNYENKLLKKNLNPFLQLSGIHVTYDIKRPNNQRIVKADVRCGNCSVPKYFPLDDRNVYTIIMSNFLYHGGDGFCMFQDESLRVDEIKANGIIQTDTDTVAKYLKKMEVIYPEIDGRITILNGSSTTSASVKLFYSNRILQTEILILMIPLLVKYLTFNL